VIVGVAPRRESADGGREGNTAPGFATDLGPDASESPAIVELRGISKSFAGVRANDDVSLVLRRGEVHCLLGENGAGKTTLMNVLAGIYQPDEGEIHIDGRPVTIGSPRDAIDLGIGMVHQHSSLIPVFTVLENLLLGRGGGVRLSADEALKAFGELSVMLDVDIDPSVRVERLSLGQQQQVEIVKALWRGSRVLILDEPSSMLTPKGVEDLQGVLVHLKERGLAIVFITHKLREAFDIGDRVSVLRQGRLVGAIDRANMGDSSFSEVRQAVVDLMFPGEGTRLAAVAEMGGPDEAARRGRRAAAGAPLLELSGVIVPGARGEVGIGDPLSLTVHAGEVVGRAGVDGNGQRPLAEAIAGQRRIAGGDLRLAGSTIRKLSVAARQRRGLRYVTDDRMGEGVVSPLSVALNLVVKRIGSPPFWVHGRTQRTAIERHARALIDEYDIMTPDVDTPAGSLSGGTTQKVVVARELSFDPLVVVFNKPTYGLDVKTTAMVRERIRSLVASGDAGALVISTDLEELLDVCDRIAVLADGRLTGVVENLPGAEQEVGALMIGAGRDE
jgi:general nucleoside transport system ATP-binding protein